MYEVLIVDDEPLARQSLRYLIDWKAYGFHISGEAEDGRQALEMMAERRYSLVLTDIRMPTMNGLDFIARLREFSDAAVVILSGYDDFEYARKGMTLGARDYLLKPVDEDDLIALLNRIAADIAARDRLDRRHHMGLSVLRDQFLRRWTHNQLSARECAEQLRLLHLPEESGGYCCLAVEMDFVYGSGAHLSERDTELKRFAVRNIAEELCMGLGYVFELTEDRYGIVLFGDDEAGLEASAERLSARLSESAVLYAKETVSIGIGVATPDPMGVPASFAAAGAALDGKFLHGNRSILRSAAGQGAKSQASPAEGALAGLQAEVLAAVREYDRDGAIAALGRLWDGFRESGAGSEIVRTAVLHIFVQLFQLARELGADTNPIFSSELGDYGQVMKARTMDELLRFAELKCSAVLDRINRAKELQPNKLIASVKRIVEQQYAGSISLRSVAEQVYLNPNYLGKLFKSATEQSFNDYLLQVRMEKAKVLLRGTDKKVYEIAQEVGYGELDWFYKRFKAYVGVSAGEFRSQGGGSGTDG